MTSLRPTFKHLQDDLRSLLDIGATRDFTRRELDSGIDLFREAFDMLRRGEIDKEEFLLMMTCLPVQVARHVFYPDTRQNRRFFRVFG